MIGSIMRSLWVSGVVALACSAPVAAQTPAAQTSAAPQLSTAQVKPAALFCTYGSKAFSDGAFVCVEKSLMLKCTVDDTKAAWSVVAEKDLSDKCRTPAARGTIYQQRARWYRQNIRREITPPG